MKYFPIYMDMRETRVLIVGGGEQAAQKLRLLLKTPVHIDVISRETIDELDNLEQTSRIVIHRRGLHRRRCYWLSAGLRCDRG